MTYRCGFKLCAPHELQSAEPPSPEREDGLRISAEFLSPPIEAPFSFREIIPSWNADCPRGSGLEIELRARLAGRAAGGPGENWTRWYGLGTWSAEVEGTLARGSVPGQDDELGRVATDTLVLKTDAEALQARIRLVALPGSPAASLRSLGLAYSSERPATFGPGPEARLRGALIAGLPASSQMIYPDGGRVWCSPTSVSMVLGYWQGRRETEESAIRRAVAGVYDPVYGGHGNWAFNTAYAASLGYEAYVRRFPSLSELEPWIEAGIPLVLSLSWDAAAGRPLSGAPLAASSGHLSLLRGFDSEGNPAMHEPAAPSDAEVPRVYDRAQLEARWLEASGGVSYLIFPIGRPHPSLEG